MNKSELGQAFLNQDQIPNVSFKHNDFVLIIAGPYTGKKGSLVTLIDLDPEPIYLLELESGYDTQVLQSQIQAIDL